MKVQAMAVLIAILIFSGFAAANSGCESEINPNVHALVSFTRSQIEREALTHDDLQAMIDGDEIHNPYLKKPRNHYTLYFSRGMAQALAIVKDHIPAVKAALLRLQSEMIRGNDQVAAAKKSTQAVLAPSVMSILPVAGGAENRILHWHRDANDDLKLAVFYLNRSVAIYDPYSKSVQTDAISVVARDFEDKIFNKNNILSTSSGELLAATVNVGVQSEITVRNFTKGTTSLGLIPFTPDGLALFEDFKGVPHLVAIGSREIAIYKIGEDTLELKRSIVTRFVIHKHELTSGPMKRKALNVWGTRNFLLLDLPSGKELVAYKSENYIRAVRTALFHSQGYAVGLALSTLAESNERTYHLEFLSSYHREPLRTHVATSQITLGEWKVMPDGRTLLPVADLSRHQAVYLFDPVQGEVEISSPSNYSFFRRKTLLPSKTFKPASFSTVDMQWLERKNETLLAILYSLQGDLASPPGMSPTSHILKLYDTWKADNPNSDPSILKLEAVYAPTFSYALQEIEGRLVFIRNIKWQPMTVLELGHAGQLATFDNSKDISTPLMVNGNGDILFLSDRSGQSLEIIRVLKANR